MKKIKLLLVMFVVTIILVILSGCEHSHDYMWVNGENPKLAFEICKACFHVRDMEKEYSRPLTVGMPDWGSVPAVDPPIGYDIELDSGMYNYNEEINITLNLYFGYPYYIYFSEGDLHVKISESEYYEIVGKDEYIVENFSAERAKEAEKLSYKFTIKATEACKGVESVEFKIKANIDAFWSGTNGSIGDPAGWYCDKSWDYCFTIFSLGFKSDSQGIIFNKYDERLFYDSINREYLSGVLSKDDYIDRFYEYYLKNVIDIDFKHYTDYSNSKGYFVYCSKNIRAEFHLSNNYDYFLSLYNDVENPLESRVELKKKLVKILLDEGYISSQEYECEIEYIEERNTTQRFGYLSYKLIPIARYFEKNKIDFTYWEEDSAFNSGNSNILGCNIASLYLSNDRIEVGGDVDVSICTELSDTIQECVIETQNGFSISSEIEFINNEIVFSVTHNEQNTSPHFQMKIVLDNDQETTFNVDLYGYVNNETLYISQWSEGDAYNAFWDYEYAEEEQAYAELKEIQQSLSNTTTARSVSSGEEYDTTISGYLYWKETEDEDESTTEKVFPLQHCMVSFYDQDAVNKEHLYSCLTDEMGYYSFSFSNDTSTVENGGLDIVMRVWAAGEDVEVTYGRIGLINLDIPYYEDYVLFNNISTGSHEAEPQTIVMETSETLKPLFGHAIQISQATIMASKYYEAMKGTDVDNVPILYPHNIKNRGCFFECEDDSNGRIYIVGGLEKHSGVIKSYESWDVLMHEYGHFVGFMEGIVDSPGGDHTIRRATAEHYYTHFTSSGRKDCSDDICAFNTKEWKGITYTYKYTEDDCKEQGDKLAWSEGWATYFSMAAQEYAQDNFYLGAVDTVGNGEYSAYNLSSVIPVENFHEGTEDTEATITAILYDMYDSNNSTTDSGFDDLALGHNVLWNLIVNSDAKTFDEFDDYFRSHHNIAVNFKEYGELLSYHNLSPYSVNSSETLTTYCPTFSWWWIEDLRAVYFNDRNFKLNFYNSSYELIGSTSEYTNVTSITVDETLWHNVLNSGDRFYVSVTIIENHEPKTDYEGQWYKFAIPVQTATIDTDYVKTLGSGDCHWYKFTVPATADYIFETSGNVDTVGDISNVLVVGRSINGLTYIYGSGGELENFRFTEYLTEGETVYIRIRGANWTSTGSYVFNIEQVEHTHDYTDHYLKISAKLHRSYCICGAYTNESHHWGISANQYICHYCGYFTKDFPSITPGIMSFDNEAALYYYGQDEEEETIR